MDEMLAWLNARESWLLSVLNGGEKEGGQNLSSGPDGWTAAYVGEIKDLCTQARKVAAPDRRASLGVVIAEHNLPPVGDEELPICGGQVWSRSVMGKGFCDTCYMREPVSWWYEACPPSPMDIMTDASVVDYLLVRYGRRIAGPGTVRVWRAKGWLPKAPVRLSGRVASYRADVDDLHEYLVELADHRSDACLA
jgi:hypothetical protein